MYLLSKLYLIKLLTKIVSFEVLMLIANNACFFPNNKVPNVILQDCCLLDYFRLGLKRDLALKVSSENDQATKRSAGVALGADSEESVAHR